MGNELRLSLTQPQTDFVTSPARYPCIVAGFGSGKTEALVSRTLVQKLSYPTCNCAYYAPTYDLIRLIAWPRIIEKLEEFEIRYTLNKSESIIYVRNAGQIICRTMENPERIVGYEVADSSIDELDTLKEDQAESAWKKIIARNRQKKPDRALNTVAVATTPEGFRFVYQRWKKSPSPGYILIPASTYSNAHNLPSDYIQSLRDSYPPRELEAYLEGKFVNLVSGPVHPDFDRTLNHTDETVKPREILHVGMDFNRLKMSATVNVVRDKLPLTLVEHCDVRDTPAMALLLKERYRDNGHRVILYPDASGNNSSSKNATESDFTILRAAGFEIVVNGSNPAIMDRVLSMNAMILNANMRRRWLINTDACPGLTEGLEQQVYDKNGMPDKSSGVDHVVDAQGYFINQRFPCKSNNMVTANLTGI